MFKLGEVCRLNQKHNDVKCTNSLPKEKSVKKPSTNSRVERTFAHYPNETQAAKPKPARPVESKNTDIENQKVRDVYHGIDHDWLYAKSYDSDYWHRAFDFYNEVASMRYKYLRESQINWLNIIEEICIKDNE